MYKNDESDYESLIFWVFQMILRSIRNAEFALFVSEGVFHFINQVKYVSEFMIAADE